MSQPLCRFAPSPNGLLHLGHAWSALRNRAVADRLGGRLLLRLEDIDTTRCTPGDEAGLRADLAWLGWHADAEVPRQTERLARYAAALDRLSARGLTYPCFCTRGDIARVVGARPGWPRDPDGAPLYPGTCRDLTAADRRARGERGLPFSLRLDGARAHAAAGSAALAWPEFREGDVPTPVPAQSQAWGDAVLKRRDIAASYHIAVVVDDAEQGITDVVRGADLFAATALHRLLQELLAYPAPAYHHHRLVLDPDGRKLAKSRGSRALADLRRAGVGPAEIPALIAARLGPPA